jgi:hypothetical protein
VHDLSNDMIKAALDARHIEYAVDANGNLVGSFEGNLIYFVRLGERSEILQIHGRMQHEFAVDDAPRLSEFCNAWNRDQYWPKAYVRVTDDGRAIVVGEVNYDWEHGVTLKQLDQVLIGGISSCCQLSNALELQYNY